MRRALLLFVTLSLLFSLFSCGDDEAIPPTEYYAHHAELALPLPDTFAQFESTEFDAAFTDELAVVGIVRFSYSAAHQNGIPATLEPAQFAEYYMTLSEREEKIKRVGDVPYYSYEENGYFYTLTFYCSKYAYFTVMYTCATEVRDTYEKQFLEYASGAYFTA